MSIIFPFGRNLLSNAGFDHHAYSGGNLNLGTEISNGYNSLDRWRVGSFGTAGTRSVLLQGSGSHDNKRTNRNALFRATSTGSSSWDVSQRIESKIATAAAADGFVSIRVPYRTDEYQELRIRLFYANTFDDFSGVTSFYDQTFPTNIDDNWHDDIVVNGIPVPPQAEQGIQFILTFLTPSEGANLHSFRLTQTMLNVGKLVLPFEYLATNPIMEDMWCKRYFRKTWALGTAVGTATFSGSFRQRMPDAVTTPFMPATLPGMTMRITPVVSLYSPNSGLGGSGGSALVFHDSGGDVAGSADFSQYGNGYIRTTAAQTALGIWGAHVTLSAEL